MITACFPGRCLRDTPGFRFTARAPDTLPPGFPVPPGDGGATTCYFLDTYAHPGTPGSDDVTEHIRRAVEQLNLEPP